MAQAPTPRFSPSGGGQPVIIQNRVPNGQQPDVTGSLGGGGGSTFRLVQSGNQGSATPSIASQAATGTPYPSGYTFGIPSGQNTVSGPGASYQPPTGSDGGGDSPAGGSYGSSWTAPGGNTVNTGSYSWPTASGGPGYLNYTPSPPGTGGFTYGAIDTGGGGGSGNTVSYGRGPALGAPTLDRSRPPQQELDAMRTPAPGPPPWIPPGSDYGSDGKPPGGGGGFPPGTDPPEPGGGGGGGQNIGGPRTGNWGPGPGANNWRSGFGPGSWAHNPGMGGLAPWWLGGSYNPYGPPPPGAVMPPSNFPNLGPGYGPGPGQHQAGDSGQHPSPGYGGSGAGVQPSYSPQFWHPNPTPTPPPPPPSEPNNHGPRMMDSGRQAAPGTMPGSGFDMNGWLRQLYDLWMSGGRGTGAGFGHPVNPLRMNGNQPWWPAINGGPGQPVWPGWPGSSYGGGNTVGMERKKRPPVDTPPIR